MVFGILTLLQVVVFLKMLLASYKYGGVTC